MNIRKRKVFSLLMAVLLSAQLLPLNTVLAADAADGGTLSAEALFRDPPSGRDLTKEIVGPTSSQAVVVHKPDGTSEGDNADHLWADPYDAASNPEGWQDTSTSNGRSTITIKGPGGSVISPDGSGNYSQIPANSTIDFHLAFHLSDEFDNGLFQAGDYFEVELPKGVEFTTPTSGLIAVGGVADVASWSIDSSSSPAKIVITFDSTKVSSMGDAERKADFSFAGKFQYLEDAGTGANPAKITFGGQTITIGRKSIDDDPKPPALSHVEKSEPSYNPQDNTITWTITITPPADAPNASEFSYKGYKITDTLTGNHTYTNDSFARNGTPEADPWPASTPSTTFTYSFPDDAKGPQTITYKTTPVFGKITGTDKNDFTNSVSLEKGPFNAGEGNMTKTYSVAQFFAKTPVDAPVRGADGKMYVKWTIDLKVPKTPGGAYSYPGAQITDTIAGGPHGFVTGNDTYPVEIKYPGEATARRVDPTGVSNGGTVALSGTSNETLTYKFDSSDPPKTSQTEAQTYTLTYYTSFNPEVDDASINAGITLKNGAKFEWDPDGDGTVGGWGGPGYIIEKRFLESGGQISKKTLNTGTFAHSDVVANRNGDFIKWEVTVNDLKIPMAQVTLYDTIASYASSAFTADTKHEFVIGADTPLTVFKNGEATGVEYTGTDTKTNGTLTVKDDFGSITVPPKYAGSAFAFQFPAPPASPGTSKDTYVVTFYTRITDLALALMYKNGTIIFNNSASLEGHAGGVTVTAPLTYSLQMLDKSNGKYDYVDHSVTWNLIVNRNRLPMNNAEITDTFMAGMELLNKGGADEGEFRVNVDGEKSGSDLVWKKLSELDSADAMTVTSLSDTSFKVVLPATSKQYTITYKTYLTDATLKESFPGNGTKKFNNSATMTGDHMTSGITDGGEVSIKNLVIEKTTDYTTASKEDIVRWSVKINPGQVPLDKAFVEDVLDPAFDLDVSSVKLYDATVNVNGTYTKGSENTAYKTNPTWLEHGTNGSGNEFFKVHLPDGPHAYVLEFSTVVMKDNVTLSNTISLSGETGSPSGQHEKTGVAISDIFSDSSGTSYTLRIKKVGADGNPLANAQFTLMRYAQQAPLTRGGNPVTGTTGPDGIVDFSGIPNWFYYVREDVPPTGYLSIGDSEKSKPALTASLNSADPEHITITNVKGKADVQINKVSAGDAPLAGAEFGLFKKGESGDPTKALDTATSTAGTGAVIFHGVEFGEYEIKELSAPDKHQLNAALIYVKVGYKDGTDYTAAEVTYSTDGASYSTSIPKFVNTPHNAGFSGNPDIVFTKLRADKPGGPETALKDVVFTLKDKTGASIITTVGDNGTAKSGADGTVRFTDVPFGKYTIFETVPPEYLNPSDAPASTPVFSVNVTHKDASDPRLGLKVLVYNAGGTLVYDSSDSATYPGAPELVNYAAVGQVKFAKKHATTDSILIQGGTFEISGTSEAGHAFKITANAVDGVVAFENVPVGTNYTIKETVPPSGYLLTAKTITGINVEYADPATRRDVVNVDLTGDPDKMLKNEPAPSSGPADGKATVKKVDADGKVLSGAEFTLYNKDGKAVASMVSGSDGLAVFTGLAPYSDYTIRETKAPDGYELSSDVLAVKTYSGSALSFTMVNKKTAADAGVIAVLKTDAEGKPLAGAEFTLYDKDGKAVAALTTGADGKVSFEKLPAGAYTVAETRVPDGYVRGAGNQAVTLAKDETKSLTVVNERKPVVPTTVLGAIRLQKVNSEKQPLAGAEFTLYAADGSVFAKKTSGGNGLVVFSDLPIGSYTVRETAAPEGYQLAEDDLNVSLPASGATLSYTLKDAALDEGPDVMGWEEDGTPGKLPQTGGAAPSFFLLLAGIALTAAGFVWNRRETLRSKRRAK